MKIFNKLNKRIKLFLNKSDLVLIEENKMINCYRDLSPLEKIENANEYIKALEWALNKRNVFNIAIAGPYGSGKSSLIKTFTKKHDELNYINISLANFIELNEEESNEETGIVNEFSESKKNNKLDEILMKGILKQLFYSVDKKRIPKSRFRKLQVMPFYKMFAFICSIFLFLYILALFFFKNINNYFNVMIEVAKSNLNFPEWVIYFLFIFLIISMLIFISRLSNMIYTKFSIKEISLSTNINANFKEEDSNSIFDKYIDEIIYFFEATKINLLFIEDLDRFDNTTIFIKLRELNTILNQYENIKRKVVFVYAIRDDVFIENDRTKFFDFIIPIIPVINSTNSENMLLYRINEDRRKGIQIDLNNNFVSSISPYIDDMRILNNTYNEFIIYKETLQKAKDLNLKDYIMFSIMVFKNLYPKEFAKIQYEKGIIKEAFEDKSNFKKSKIVDLNERKEKIIQQLNKAEEDILNDIKEVKIVMLGFMTNYLGYPYDIRVNGTMYTPDHILSDDFDLEQLRDECFVYYNKNCGSSDYCTFDGKIKFIDKNDFIKRCNVISNKLPEKRDKLEIKISKIDFEIFQVKCYSLRDMFEKYEIEDVLTENVRQNKLLIFLLRKGYITEEYANYINYFYPDTMTIDDMNFILSIRNHEALPFEYELTKIEKIIDKLEIYEFEQKEIYNFDLLEYLLSTELYLDKRIKLFEQLSDENILSWNFINEFIEITKFKPMFISLLSEHWNDLWNYIYRYNGIPNKRKMYFLKSICENISSSKIIELNNADHIKDYFENQPDILQNLTNVSQVKLQEIIVGCNIKFTHLYIQNVCNDLVEWIFENKKFSLTFYMIKVISKFNKCDCLDDLEHRNYTIIRKLNYTPLLELVKDDIEHYIENVVLAKNNIHEDLEAVLELISISKNVSLSLKLIEKEIVMLDDFHECEFEFYVEDIDRLESVWNQWIDCKKITYTWSNLIAYWEYFGVTEKLLDYLEEGINTIINDQCPKDIDHYFIKEIIKSNIGLENLRIFIQNTPKINELNISEISANNMKVLIEEKYFEFDLEFVDKIKAYHPDLFSYSLVVNILDILDEIEKYNLKQDEIEYILDSNNIDNEVKVTIITRSNLDKFSKKISYFVYNCNVDLGQEVFEKVWEEIQLKDKYQYLLNNIKNIDITLIEKCLSQFEGSYVELADRKSRHLVKLYKNEYNIHLAQKLEEIGLLTSFKENGALLECWVKKNN